MTSSKYQGIWLAISSPDCEVKDAIPFAGDGILFRRPAGKVKDVIPL